MSQESTPALAFDLWGDMVPQLMEAMSDAIHTTMNEAFSAKTDIKPWTLARGDKTPAVVFPVCTIDIVDAFKHRYGTFILLFNRDAALKILGAYGNANANEGVVNDAVCEIANMVYGVFKTTVNKLGCQLIMQLPVAQHEKYPLPEVLGKGEKIVLPFDTEGYHCQAVLARAS
jgi:CheY-specific phosphatase CheX